MFDGLGHTIDGLVINRPTMDDVGLFGSMGDGSVVRNVGLRGGSTRGHDNTGALAGLIDRGQISHAYATGDVHGADNVGGLVGYLSTAGRVDHLYATGDVEGTGNTGGLLGSATNNVLRYAYASGNVRGGNAGGLAGYFESYSLWYAYATGEVTGTQSAGGLVGAWRHGTLWYSYASGKVTGVASAATGGLIGKSEDTDTIGSYWDKTSTGQAQVCGGVGAAPCSSSAGLEPLGLDTSDIFQQASYAHFDFANTWYMVDGQTRPFLRFEYATSINNAHQLQLVNLGLSASYTLAADIDASETARALNGSTPGDASGMWSNAGFAPIGNFADPFTGSFDGLGHTITHLTIDRPTVDFVGLFGMAGSGAAIRNLGMENGKVRGQYQVGGLVGYNQGELSNVHAAGEVTGGVSGSTGDVGGLVGLNEGSITHAYASGTAVSGGLGVGGLIGLNQGALTNVYATASVTGDRNLGGLAGSNMGTIVNAFASGAVNGSSSLGGLVGDNSGSIDSAYATGVVTGSGSQVGGLVGIHILGTISNAYATGSVSGSQRVGGLVGNSMGAISDAYATGAVTGSVATGGLIGMNQNSVLRSYWDTDTTGQASGSGSGSATGIVGGCMADACTNGGTVNLTQLASFSGWDISGQGGSAAVWRIYEGHTAPLLRAFMTAASGSVGNASKTYDGAAFGDYTVDPATLVVTPSFWLPSTTLDPGLVLGQAHSNAVNAGSYTLDGAGLYFGQMSYDLDVVPGTLVIDPKALTVTLTGGLDKVYDGGTGIALTSGNYLLSGFVGSEGATITETAGNYNSKNVADADTVTVTLTGSSFSAGSGTLLSNYVLPATASGTGHITPRGITVGATASDKVYDATTSATVTLGSSGILTGDAVSFAGTGHFADKNAGNGKTVTVNGITASGADAGNYSFNTSATDTANISQRGITVDATANDKVYDATTNATVTLGSSGILAGDAVTLAGTGRFADKNVGTAKAVTVDLDASGTDAGNYAFQVAPGTAADITPATLVYQADPASFPSGGDWGLLGGTVSGLVGDDTLADSTDGILAWQTPATAASPVGTYAINGSGLSAGNYVFVQAPGNATALHLSASEVPAPVAVPGLVGRTVARLQQTDDTDEAPAPYAPDVRIVNGGVRLP